jgi:poly-gamma-glutamate synthesis protein (capsule biosynthesis protein)
MIRIRCDSLAGALAAVFLAACTAVFPGGAPSTSAPAGAGTATPFLPLAPSATPAVTRLWVSPSVPRVLRNEIERAGRALAPSVEIVTEAQAGSLQVLPGGVFPMARWTFAVAAPFATVRDAIGLTELRSTWQAAEPSGLPVFASGETVEAMRGVLGEPGVNVRSIDNPETLVDSAWDSRPSLAIVPFEALEPRWKVLELDGQSPIRRDFDPGKYPLQVTYGLEAGELPLEMRQELEAAEGVRLPLTNRRDDRLTTVVMTGVTALTRATAWEMDRTGVTLPARDIGDWLRQADVTHISHEVAFTPDCPPPSPNLAVLIFCAQPGHIALLEDVGTDVIELTGNHVLDAGKEALRYSLDLYRANGWQWFGGGGDLAEARQPVLIEHNGNRIAFVGCNEAGPPGAWATPGQPGANPCGRDRLAAQVSALRDDGYLPIFTFQWHEHYTPRPPASQQEAFQAAAEAGAVAVSGSQAHQPQGFAFANGAFIHYGLGNLFFDQMWSEAVRQEFIDRYVFHNGRLISVELLTAHLEDWSRPRPMTPTEREAFLQAMFTASGW